MTKARAKSSNKVQHLVANNPEYDRRTKDPKEIAADKKEIRSTLYDSSSCESNGKIDRIIEAFRKTKEDATLNRIISKREPGEPVKTQYQKVADKDKWKKSMDFWRQKNRSDAAREKLKKKGKVPVKGGTPMFDEYDMLDEDFNKFASIIRRYYYSGKMMRFRDWLNIMDDIIDELN